MSDFLHNIMSRTLGQAPMVRPRPLALFEPARLAGLPALGPSPEQAGAEEQLDEAPPTPGTRPPARAAAPAATTPVQPVRAGQPGAPDEAHFGSIPARTAFPAPPTEARSAEPRAVPAERQTLQPRPAAPVPPNPQSPSAATPETPASRPFQNDPTIAPAQPRAAVPIITQIVERAAEHAARPLQPNPPAAVLATPQIAPYAEPMPAQAAPAPAPTITVTIGRIEVRAHVQGAPAAAPRGQPRVMSLDEYLRERSGGGAR